LVERGIGRLRIGSSDGRSSQSVSIFYLKPLLVEDLSLCRELSVWPSHLRLEIVGTQIHALDFQAWILKHRASVVRIKCAADTSQQDFGKLVRSLREDARVSHHGSPRLVSHRLAGRDCTDGDRRLSRARSCSGTTLWGSPLCRVPHF
jgi:hypothetical protein